MKTVILAIFFLLGANAFGQLPVKTAKTPAEFVPAGHIIFSEIQGDLNNDNQPDYVLITKGTNKNDVIKHEYRGELDRNRRGIIIAIKNNDHYDLILRKLDCFSSENEDGGVYYAPELDVSIDKGNLLFHYAHGRYGYWRYKFQYRNQDFQLIGYDASSNHGPVIEREVSINFIAKKEKIRENTNQYAEGGDEKFKETWKKFTLPRLIRLREISNFDDFNVESAILPVR